MGWVVAGALAFALLAWSLATISVPWWGILTVFSLMALVVCVFVLVAMLGSVMRWP